MILNFYLRKVQPPRQVSPLEQENLDKIKGILRKRGLSASDVERMPYETALRTLAHIIARETREGTFKIVS